MDTVDQSSLQGCTSVTLHARINRVAYTWLGSTPPRLSDTRSPSYGSSERSPSVYSPKGKGVMGLSPLALRVGVRREIRTPEVTISPGHNAELDVFHSFRTRPQRGGPTP